MRMDAMLQTRLQMRQRQLAEAMEEARHVIKQCGEQGASNEDFTRARLKLKQATDNFEKDVHSFIEKSTAEDSNDSVRKYTELQIKAEDLSIEFETINHVRSQSQTDVHSRAVSAKLPKLEMAKFNGDILQWNEFWDRFEANVDSKNLKEVEKLAYLLGSLDGKARETVQGLCTTNANYLVAVDTLKKRFGSTTRVVDAHYTALNDIKRCEDNTGDCRRTLDCIERHLRVLHNLGEKIDNNHLRVTLMSKFPEKIKYQVGLLSPDDHTVTTLRKSLDQIVTAMERADPVPPTPDPDLGNANQITTGALHVKTHPQKNSRPTANEKSRKRRGPATSGYKEESPAAKRTKYLCIFCNGDHFSSTCSRVRTIEERKRKLGDRCYRCFQSGHRMMKCKLRRKCFQCKKNDHHQALCPKICGMQDSSPKITAYETGCNLSDVKSFLQTAVIKLRGPSNNQETACRLLLDSGSQRSYITTSMAKKLKLTPDRDDLLMMFTFGLDAPKTIHSPSAEIYIETKRGIRRGIRVNIVPHITNKIPITSVETNEAVDFLADDNSVGEDVDLLIGNDYYFYFIRNEQDRTIKGLILVNTDFGWIVSGNKTENKQENTLSVITYYCQCHDSSCSYFTEPDLPLRNIDMKFLWSLESIGITDSPKTTREEDAVKHFNQTVKYINGRYEVKWPWIHYPPDLPTNYSLAYGRLKSLLRRSDKRTLKEYERILKEQLNSNIIEAIEPQTKPIYQASPPVHYLPHHMVKQEGRSGRIVYDASAKIKGHSSLNECMYRGPSLLEDLTALILKFRTGKVGITADVEKAFLQVGLQEEDRNVTRFLWIKDPTRELTEDNICHYRFRRVPFGLISSPFLLTATIRYHISKTNESLLTKIAERCYVDNLVTSEESVDKALQLYEETKSIFNELSMNIRDWVSNDEGFMERIPEEQKGEQKDTVKILGLTWNLKEDSLQLKFNEEELQAQCKGNLTKKDVLRALARVYDPCGFASPLVLPAKLLFQELCVMKFKWDTPLPNEIVCKWEAILEKLKAAKRIKVPRHVGSHMSRGATTYELHVYTDASRCAYATVAYLRVITERHIRTAFLMSKSRVAPTEDKNDLKIPRLELLGYLIGSRLLKYLKGNLNLPIGKMYLWTDSQVVLHWLKSNNLLPPFVKRRIDEINQLKDVEFCYINTHDNPADVATRPESWELKKDLWSSGPSYLIKDSKSWPSNIHLKEKILLSAGEVLDAVDGPETEIKGYEQDHPNHLIEKDQEMASCANPELTQNTESAATNALKQLQSEYFPDEVKGKRTPLARNLNLFLDIDGVLRCGGRMRNTNWPYEKRHPILIPKNCEFTYKVVQEIHQKNYHVGVPHTLSIIRENYWIPQGRAQVQKAIKKCTQCMKHSGGPYKLPQTPALPPERVNYSAPFTYTGTDYFGPTYVSTANGSKEKRWICLFTCLAVRAIHLEIVNEMTAEQCLLAIRRFVATRGAPAVIISDNALQFKLTSELVINSYCADNKVKWKFIPQLAPWYGGVYERLVGLIKHCLKRTLEKHLLNDTELLTVMKEVEAVINTRPLTSVGSDFDHALRPADFLTLGKCLEMNPSENTTQVESTATKTELIRGWKRGQLILGEFKKMFQNQYLPSLREKHKGFVKQPRVISDKTPQLGDVVQIKGDSKNRENWKVGKITSLLKGADGECRTAKIKVGNVELTRSIAHLYPLEAELEVDQMNVQDADSRRMENTNVSRESIPPNLNQTRPSEQPAPSNKVPSNEEMNSSVVIEPSAVAEPMDIEISVPSPVNDPSILTPGPRQANQNEPSLNSTKEDLRLEEKAQERMDEDTEPRAVRAAAARAREKIAQWTRNLTSLL